MPLVVWFSFLVANVSGFDRPSEGENNESLLLYKWMLIIIDAYHSFCHLFLSAAEAFRFLLLIYIYEDKLDLDNEKL